jgi:hypothetical protein
MTLHSLRQSPQGPELKTLLERVYGHLHVEPLRVTTLVAVAHLLDPCVILASVD